jgi:hypothetical protein
MREEWVTLLEGTDTCFAPVLLLSEVASHPHMAAREAIVELDGTAHSGPAPKFSRIPGKLAKSHEGVINNLHTIQWPSAAESFPCAILRSSPVVVYCPYTPRASSRRFATRVHPHAVSEYKRRT